MAVSRELTKQTARLKLNNGLSPAGTVQTVSQTFPTLATTYTSTDDATLVGIVEALANCLTKSLVAIEYVGTYELKDL